MKEVFTQHSFLRIVILAIFLALFAFLNPCTIETYLANIPLILVGSGQVRDQAKRRLPRWPIATLPKAAMIFTSFVSSLFPTVYADAPAEESRVEESRVEETQEVSEEPVEETAGETAEEEEPEPEDVSIPLSPTFFM